MRFVGPRGRRFVWLALAAVAGCARQQTPDAYGNVEATEVVVSAEATGRLTTFDVQEGQTLAQGASVGAIDATDLALQRDQLSAERAASASHGTEVGLQAGALASQRDATEAQQTAATAQRAVLVTQLDIARRAYERTERLFSEQAATSQQLDQAEKDYRVLEDQIKAQDAQIATHGKQGAAQDQQTAASHAEQQTVAHQTAAVDAQIAQVDERIAKSHITNPAPGTVLVTYAKAGEVVQPGQPLYKIADLTAVDVRAYVAETELAAVRVGQQAQVTVDVGRGERQVLTGTVSWISGEAEFTPTPIQTRDERADLVYALKIHVSNPQGVLKIGMPVDVQFAKAGASQ